MALIRCPECSRDISDRAAACPRCGRPLKALAQLVWKALMVVGGLMVVVAYFKYYWAYFGSLDVDITARRQAMSIFAIGVLIWILGWWNRR